MPDVGTPTESVATISVTAIIDRLTAIGEHDLARLGYRTEDCNDALHAIAQALRDPKVLEMVALLAGRLRRRIGDFTGARLDDHGGPLDYPMTGHQQWSTGVVAMLALIATTPDVSAFHSDRGIPAQLSNVTLSDLGQQVWVHRRTFGEFGLHTYGWMQVAWSGALYWLGRLQFNLIAKADQWMISTHIPETGPLHPDLVTDAFGRARAFFARHFFDYPTRLFHCRSWLLDPQLCQVLRPGANMVSFQQLWQLCAGSGDGDADALFFVFHRRGEVDRTGLPRETSLQRAILDKIDNGGHWQVREGTIDQDQFPDVDASDQSEGPDADERAKLR